MIEQAVELVEETVELTETEVEAVAGGEYGTLSPF